MKILFEFDSECFFNLFKGIVDMLDDIVRRDGNTAVTGRIDIKQAGMNSSRVAVGMGGTGAI